MSSSGNFLYWRSGIRIVSAMMAATTGVRFIRHRDCNGRPVVEVDKHSLGHHRTSCL